MKNQFQKKSLVALVIVCSMFSSVYLQLSDSKRSTNLDRQSVTGQYIREQGYAPEVKIVKTIIRTIFNVVKAS